MDTKPVNKPAPSQRLKAPAHPTEGQLLGSPTCPWPSPFTGPWGPKVTCGAFKTTRVEVLARLSSQRDPDLGDLCKSPRQFCSQPESRSLQESQEQAPFKEKQTQKGRSLPGRWTLQPPRASPRASRLCIPCWRSTGGPTGEAWLEELPPLKFVSTQNLRLGPYLERGSS